MPNAMQASRQRYAGRRPDIYSTAGLIRVQVVDDHPAVRRGLVQLLEEQPDLLVTAVAADATGALAQVKRESIDIAVVDYHLDGLNGLWLSQQMQRLRDPPRLVMYSAYANDHLAASCVVADVDAVLNKGGLGSELCDAIRAVAHGRRLLPSLPQPLADLLSRRLDDGELPIFGMLLAGISRAEICQTMRISEAELASRKVSMLRKLEALPGEADGRRPGRRRIGLERRRPQPRADAGLSM
ncbi:MAG TPA: response regulator transcription factor [Solirubrobacteraceae bacterium]|nr:response regulator transcription factor [Solirubrobacteraceae bacterium]